MRSPTAAATRAPIARKRAERQRVFHVAAVERDHRDADDRTEERREHQRQQHQLPSEKGADHRQHLHVAESHAFFVAEAEVDLAHQPQRSAAENDADERVAPAGRQEEAEDKPEHDARQRDDVGQDAMLEVDDEQHDHRAREQQPLNQQRGESNSRYAARNTSAGDELDNRVLNRNRRAAAAAAAAQPEIAGDRDVVVRLDRAPGSAGNAMPATSATRAAAAGGCRRSENCRRPVPKIVMQDRGRDVHRGTGGASRFSSGAAAGSVGSGHKRRFRRHADLARVGDRACKACRPDRAARRARAPAAVELLPRFRAAARFAR